ncbi:MotE family protein [Paenibacillus tarimensis]|uniref:MotE family protein n=1 Tax=Paenibacillus tarimensis TaxID=416012 RepID=UPI001F22B442|nr:MgtE protein [Paenibacillus tarimensis]MCF2942307.1 MgtE protein [Paenibacillus tarimensis]
MADTEKEKGYSGMERFMFFLTPILFTLVLLGVLMTLFNIDLRNKFLEIGNKVPVLEKVLPEVPKDPNAQVEESDTETQAAEVDSNRVKELEKKLAEKEAEVAKLSADLEGQEQAVSELQAKLDEMDKVGTVQQQSDEEYQARISGLANMFGQLSASKAAPILQSMTLEEMVLIMDAMRPDVRASIMEKMNPKIAAEATVMLKDTMPVKDKQIAALQARLKEQQTTTTPTSSSSFLDQTQVSSTFGNMPPASAAKLLLQMAEVSPSKVLQALNAVNDQARSNILDEMSKLNEKYTAQLMTKLMSGK